MSSKAYIFIISSLNHPIYRQVHAKRRSLLKRYGLPYSVLINHAENDLEDKSISTLTPVEEDELLFNGAGMNPFMAQKFLYATKMLFRSYASFDDVPNYIIRLNATVFVHFPSILKALDTLPRTNVVAGPIWGSWVFVQGMVMVFSKDTLRNMLSDKRMYSKEIMRLNDDVSLSVLSKPKAEWVSWSDHMVWPNDVNTENGRYIMEKINPIPNNMWMFRICHWNDRSIDLDNWDIITRYYNAHTESVLTVPIPLIKQEQSSYTPSTSLICLSVVIIFFAIISILIKYYYKKQI